MSEMKDYGQLILGNALDVIIQEERRAMPVISEYQFQMEVLDILENPFGQDALTRYSTYVGELTKPLNVVDNHDREKVLFTVPALVQSPLTTMAYGHGITAEQFMNSLSRDIDLGGHHLIEKIRNFMMAMTRRPNYLEAVIYPIQQILARYDRKMVPLPGVDARHVPSPDPTVPPASSFSSFSEEYDD